MRLTAIATTLLLLAPMGCIPMSLIPRAQLDGWSVVQVGDLRLLGDIAAEDIQHFADDLALFDATFAHLVGWSPGTGAVPTTVLLIRDPELARRFDLGEGALGWAHVTLDGAFAAVLVRPNYGSTRSILFHEYTHVLQHRGLRAPMPRWYGEGIASFFQTLNARDGGVVVGAPPQIAVTRFRSHGPMALDELFEANVRQLDGKGIADFYATAWVLSHYLLLTPGGRREMERLVEQLSRGAFPEEAQRIAFGRPLSELEAELRAYVAHLARGVPAEVVFELEALDVAEAGRAAPLPLEEVADALGRMALQRARSGEAGRDRTLALRLLGMVASQQPRSACSEAAFGEALAIAGRTRHAETAIGRALVRAPDDPCVQRSAGRVELTRAEATGAEPTAAALEDAQSHFRRSLERDPRSASAWFGLGLALDRAERSEEALSAFRKARQLGWSHRLDLALGELELRRGRTQRAFELLWPLVQDPHGGATRDEASRLLEEAGLLPEAAGDTGA